MSYELHVLVVGQTTPVMPPFPISFRIENEIDHPNKAGRYYDMWPFFMQTQGVMYSLGRLIADYFLSALTICDADFDQEFVPDANTDWIPPEAQECLHPLYIFENQFEELKRVLSFLLDSSPKKLMMFHTRYQGGDTEIICGSLERDVFFKKLQKRELYFNVCYIVHG